MPCFLRPTRCQPKRLGDSHGGKCGLLGALSTAASNVQWWRQGHTEKVFGKPKSEGSPKGDTENRMFQDLQALKETSCAYKGGRRSAKGKKGIKDANAKSRGGSVGLAVARENRRRSSLRRKTRQTAKETKKEERQSAALSAGRDSEPRNSEAMTGATRAERSKGTDKSIRRDGRSFRGAS